MTAHTDAHVRCDATEPWPSSPTGKRQCPEKAEGGEQPDGRWVFPRTKIEARRLAKSLGWLTGVRLNAVGRGDFDYCPAHKLNREG